MIEAKELTMKFDDFVALDQMCCRIPSGCVYGLIGSNGAGKSTFLRLLSGVYQPSMGEILFDGQTVFNNPEVKKDIFFIPDDFYFPQHSSMDRLAASLSVLYPAFDKEIYKSLTQTFGLNPRAEIRSFSKGMKRQASTILGLAVRSRYLFFDETFDGLDPIMRNLVKDVIRRDCSERGTTTIIASHSLRELEDICDQLTLLHRGGVIFESDIANLQTKVFKIQVAFANPYSNDIFEPLNARTIKRHGSVAELVLSGDKEEALERLKAMSPTLLELLPLSLEEVFVYEIEALGYKPSDVFA